MSVAIGEYTNTAKIRGALGFTISDVTDLYIIDLDLAEELLSSLYEWIPNHKTLYTAWILSGATEDEKHYARLLKKYCTYIGAFHLSSGLELLAVQAIGDSKATAERFSSVKLQELRKRMEAIALGARSNMTELLSLSTGSTTATIFSSVSPATDPVVEP